MRSLGKRGLNQSEAPMGHVSEDSLEFYSMGRLPEVNLGIVEEHLLLCPACRSHVEESEEFVRTLREATPAVIAQPKRADVKMHNFLHWLLGGSTRWRPTCRLAGALALLLVMVATRPPATDPVAEVHLQATRSSGAIEAEANRPLSLRLDLSLLPPQPAYRVLVSHWSGRIVWQSSVSPRGDNVTAAVRSGLNAGQYWVRLYSGSTLLREYSLRVQ